MKLTSWIHVWDYVFRSNGLYQPPSREARYTVGLPDDGWRSTLKRKKRCFLICFFFQTKMMRWVSLGGRCESTRSFFPHDLWKKKNICCIQDTVSSHRDVSAHMFSLCLEGEPQKDCEWGRWSLRFYLTNNRRRKSSITWKEEKSKKLRDLFPI